MGELSNHPQYSPDKIERILSTTSSIKPTILDGLEAQVSANPELLLNIADLVFDSGFCELAQREGLVHQYACPYDMETLRYKKELMELQYELPTYESLNTD